jgi:hypothetical protein
MRRRGQIVFLVIVSALLCAGAAASTASADLLWSKPRQLTPPFSAEPQALMDERGQALLTWGQRKGFGPDRGVFSYRWRAPDGRWSPTRTLPSIRADYETEVAMTPQGEAVMTFGDPDSEPLYSIAEPGGEFSAPKRLGEPGEEGRVDLAMDDAGNAVAAWLHRPRNNGEGGASVRVATRRAGEGFAPARTVDTLTAQQVTQSAMIGPNASVNDAGAAAIVWQAGQGPGPDGFWRVRHRLAYRAPGGSFGAPEDVPLPPGKSSAIDQRVTLNENGDAVVTLQEFPMGSSGGVSYAVRSATGGWGEAREVGRLGYVADTFAEPGGAVSFLIQRLADQGPGGYEPDKPQDYRRYVDFAIHRADGELDGPRQVSTADGYSPDAAMNQRGDILATWTVGGNGEFRAARVAVSERLAGTLFTPELVMSGPDVWPPQVSLNNARQASLVWNADDEPGGEYAPTAWGSFRMDPKLPPLPLPPVIDIGDPLGDDPLGDLLDEGGIVLPVRCDQACTVRPEGLLFDAGDGKRAKKGARVKVPKGRRGRVRVRFDADTRAAAREALAAGRKPWVSVSVRAKGKSPRTVSASRRVKLRRR